MLLSVLELAHCAGAFDNSGVSLSSREIAIRVGYAISLCAEMASSLLLEHWTPAGLWQITSPDPEGKPLPAFAYKAMEKLDWRAKSPEDVHTCSRIKRMAEESASRALRAGAARAKVIDALVQSYPWKTTVQKQTLDKALPTGVSQVWVRNLRRLVCQSLKTTGILPIHLTDLEPEAHSCKSLLLFVTDDQYVCMTWCPDIKDAIILELLLPTCSRPASRVDWSWHTLFVTIPDYACKEGITPCLPTLRVVDGRLRIDLPLERAKPTVTKVHWRTLGVDWGISHLATASVEWFDNKGVVRTDGRPLIFDSSGIQAKYHRVRKEMEKVRAKHDCYSRLLEGTPVNRTELEALRDRKVLLLKDLSSRMSNANRETAALAAKWLVLQAKANGCTLISFEDLKDLEAQGMGKNLNGKISAQVRGKVVEKTTYLAAQFGIAVETVNARGTSSLCPRCPNPTNHVLASDNLRNGWHWALCPKCQHQSDRDHAASERIGMRGLLMTNAVIAQQESKDVPVRITRTKLSKRQKLPEISKNNIPHLHRRLEAKKSTATQAPNSYAITTNGQGACSPGSSELFVPRTTSHRSPGQGNAGRTLTLSPS